ncbi:hypothetical protein BKA83DRAFT_105977 [Pisolithus microcarpus]|nr:hypothetical protein BKA83DRAFT_105977 [Pisolithus microcarpus]
MESTVVLQSMYCNRLSGQLAAQEERQKKQKMGKLNADGLPKLLTGDAFQACVDEHEAAAKRDKAEQENWQKQKEVQSELMAAWKEMDNAWKQRNKERREAYHDELHLWQAERALAKQEGRHSSQKKPKLGKLEVAAPKPGGESVDGGVAGGHSGGNEEESDDGTQTDGGSDDD